MPEQRCFPDHTGVPFQPDPPHVDGFVEPESFMTWSFGTQAAEVDTGWAASSLSTFGTDTSVGLGPPLVEFRGIKHNAADRIFLSFIVRRDLAFNDSDRVILVFRPDFAVANTSGSQNGNERRIDISPVLSNVGAGVAAPNESHTPPGGGITYDFKADRPPANVEYMEWDTTSSSWVIFAAGEVPNIDIKVRSWEPAGSPGSAGYSANWSLEIELPTTSTADPGWIDLTGRFGFYFNVIRTLTDTALPLPNNPNSAIEFTWPRIDYTAVPPFRLIQDPAFGLLNQEIDPAWLGEVILGSGPDCTAVSGVKFDGGYQSIGVVDGTNPLTNEIDAFQPNTFRAKILNDSVDRPGENITAEFRIANWGIGPGTNPKWNLVPSDAGDNPTGPIDLAQMSTAPGALPDTGDLDTVWTLDGAERGQITGGVLDDHQCIWVTLDSDQDVDFTESSKRRNMNIVGLSKHEQDAEISGVGYPEPRGGDHDMVLMSTTLPFVRPFARRADPLSPLNEKIDVDEVLEMRASNPGGLQRQYVWVVITDGFRRLDHEIQIDGTKFVLLQPTGSFGYTAHHASPGYADVRYWIHGGNVTGGGPGLHRVLVRHDGAEKIGTTLDARDFEEPPRPDEPWPDDDKPYDPRDDKPNEPERPVKPPWWRTVVGRIRRWVIRDDG